jgi:hypothetical protein
MRLSEQYRDRTYPHDESPSKSDSPTEMLCDRTPSLQKAASLGTIEVGYQKDS